MTAYYLDLRANGFPVDQALKVVRHEVGHWIVGQYHGFTGGDLEITVVADNHYRGHAIIQLESDLTSIDLVQSYVSRRISVLYAGVLAESLSNGKVSDAFAVNELEKGGATNDNKGIRELVRILRGITNGAPPIDDNKTEKQFRLLTNPIWSETTGIVETNSNLIEHLTHEILGRAEKVGKKFGYRAPTFRKIPALKAWLEALPKGGA